MAKNYQRHSKGGRFKRADIGDAGISSLRQQQQTIIDAIKLQQAQDKDISRDQLSGFRETAQTEARNRQTLADLESTIYSVKRENIQKRQKTEVEKLEDQAKEYEKQSQFWKDFSTTYSKQYGDAAKEVWDFKDRMWADKSQQFFIDQYPNLIDFETDTLEKGVHLTLEESLNKTTEDRLSKAKDEETKEAIRNEQKTILRLMHRSNKYLDDIKVKAFTDDINQIEENLKRTIRESDLKWEPGTIVGHYEQAAKNLIIKSGIKQNSSAARKLHALFIRKGTAAAHKLDLKQDAIQDKELIDNNALAIPGLPVEKRPQATKELFLNVKNATRQDSNGKFTIGMDDNKEAYWATAQVLAEHYTDEKAFVEVMQSMKVDSGKKGGGDVAWNVRFEKQSASEQLRLEEIWLDTNKDKITQDKNRKALEDKAGEDEVGAVLGREDFDPTTKAGVEELNALEFKHAGNPNSLKLIQTAQNFQFEGKNEFYLTEQLVNSWKKGIPTEFLEIYNLSNAKFKAKHKGLFDDMNALIAAQPSGEGITSYAEGEILSASKVISFNSPNSKGLERVVDAYENVFYKKFNELKGIGDPFERWNQAQTYADGLLADTENGIFRRSETNAVVTWHSFTPEQDTSWSADDIDEELGISEIAIPGKIKNIITQHQDGTKTLVSQDEQDLLLRNITAGKTASVPEDIDHLWHYKTDKKENETIEDFVSEIMGIEIPEGTFKFYNFIERQSPLRVPMYGSYTNLEKAFVNGIRVEFDEWPASTQLTTLIETAGGLENITEDNNYYSLNEPVRDWTLYFRQQ